MISTFGDVLRAVVALGGSAFIMGCVVVGVVKLLDVLFTGDEQEDD